MAEVTTTFTPEVQIVPWQGANDVVRERSDIARAEVRFVVKGGTIANPGAGNNQVVDVACNLPMNFAYCLVDAFVGIGGSTSSSDNNFELLGQCSAFQSTTVTDSDYYLNMNWKSDGVYYSGTDIANLAFCIPCVPTFVIVPKDGANGLVLNHFQNRTANDQAYNFNFMLRFIQYDINQSNHWQVNTPTLTR